MVAILCVFYGQPIVEVRSTNIAELGESVEPIEQKSEQEPEPQPAKPKVVEKPEPKPDPQPTYPVGCELYRHLIEQYSWNVSTAMAVMRAESGCNPNAANWRDRHNICTGSFGLFQISCHDGAIYDPAKNVAAAWGKYKARGWWPWGVCTNGTVDCGL